MCWRKTNVSTTCPETEEFHVRSARAERAMRKDDYRIGAIFLRKICDDRKILHALLIAKRDRRTADVQCAGAYVVRFAGKCGRTDRSKHRYDADEESFGHIRLVNDRILRLFR